MHAQHEQPVCIMATGPEQEHAFECPACAGALTAGAVCVFRREGEASWCSCRCEEVEAWLRTPQLEQQMEVRVRG